MKHPIPLKPGEAGTGCGFGGDYHFTLSSLFLVEQGQDIPLEVIQDLLVRHQKWQSIGLLPVQSKSCGIAVDECMAFKIAIDEDLDNLVLSLSCFTSRQAAKTQRIESNPLWLCVACPFNFTEGIA